MSRREITDRAARAAGYLTLVVLAVVAVALYLSAPDIGLLPW